MDAQRALLDSLMGAERNAALEDREKFRRKFHDRSICKPFLCGLCPIETLAQTKSEVLTGEHRAGSEHDLRCKQEWENLDPEERKEYGYEYDLLEWLDKLVKEVAEKAEEPPPEKKLSEEEQERVLKLTAEIDELVVEAERLGENGEVEKSKAVGEKVEALKFQIDQIKKPDKPRSFPNRSLVVCEVSGNLLCSTDTEDRKARHYAGRHYTGWTAIRAKLEELKRMLASVQATGDLCRDKNGDGRSSGNNRDRSRERGDRDRDRDRDRRRGDRDRRERDHRDRDRRDRRRRRDRSDSRDRRRRRDRSRSRSRRRR